MRPVHCVLAAVIATVVVVGWLQDKPVASQFDPELHGAFKDKWEHAHEDLGGAAEREAAFRANWDGRVHITYWEKWGAFEGQAAQKMVEAFNRSQEAIYCHYIRTSQVDRKTMLAIVGGSPPDVAGLWADNVAPFAEANALMPLDGRMAAAGLKADHYVPNYLRLCQYRGRTYALPSTPATIALFYNRDHFRRKADALRAAGLEANRPPRTIDELDRYADALSEFHADGTPKVMGFLPTEPGWFVTSWGYFFGGRLMDEKTGAVTTDMPENVRAYEWLKSYATRYGRTNLTRFREGFGNYDSPQNAFIDGKVSMVLHGTYFTAFIDRHNPHLDYGVVPFPCAAGVPGPRSLMTEDVLMLPRGCPHPDAAWTFLHWVQTEGLPIICRLLGRHLPINLPGPKAYQDFARAHPNPFLNVFHDLAHSEHSFIMPQSIIWREYQDEVRRMFDHIWHWKVPEDRLAGLRGQARDDRVRALCREEIVRTLGDVRRRMESRLAQKQRRVRMRAERDAP